MLKRLLLCGILATISARPASAGSGAVPSSAEAVGIDERTPVPVPEPTRSRFGITGRASTSGPSPGSGTLRSRWRCWSRGRRHGCATWRARVGTGLVPDGRGLRRPLRPRRLSGRIAAEVLRRVRPPARVRAVEADVRQMVRRLAQGARPGRARRVLLRLGPVPGDQAGAEDVVADRECAWSCRSSPS